MISRPLRTRLHRKLRSTKANRCRRPRLEFLERRELLDGFGFADFSDTTGLTLLDNATITPANELRLSPSLVEARGNVWYTEKQFVSVGFETTFDFRMSGGTGYGMAFVVQNESPVSLGRADRGMGYQMIANSLAVEFDTVMNGDDPDANHVSVQTNGTGYNSQTAAQSLGLASPNLDLNDGAVHTARVRYLPGSLSVFVDDLVSPLLSVAVDLSETLDLDLGRAWVGFGAASDHIAGLSQNHDVLNWEFHQLVDTSQVFGISSTSVSEGNAGTKTLDFVVTRLGDTSGVATLNWTTREGTATTGVDYVAESGQIGFAPGQSEQTISVTVNGDRAPEANETFFIDLSLAVGSAVLGAATATGTILNDDVTLSIADATPTEGSQAWRYVDDFVQAVTTTLVDPRHAIFGPDGDLYVGSRLTDNVHRFDGDTGQFTDIFVETVPGFLDDPRGMVFGPDGNFYVGSADDRVLRYDGMTGAYIDEFVTAGTTGLDRPEGMAFGPDGNLYVCDRLNHRVLRFNGTSGQFIDEFVPSGSGGLSSAEYLVFGNDGHLYISSDVSDEILRYNGTTGEFIDAFVSAGSGGLNSPHGIVFGPDGDLYVSSLSSNEVRRYSGSTGAFIEVIGSQSNGGLTRPQGLVFGGDGLLYVVGQDLDQPSVATDDRVLRYGAQSLTVLTVGLSAPAGVPVTVDYSTADGSALAGSDYTAVSGTLTFAPGETTKTILVKTLDNGVYEGDETFVVNLSNASAGATIVDGQGVATIVDSDSAPSISIGDVTVTEGAAVEAVFTITLSTAADVPITVNYATANGSATAGSDYTAVSGQITFTPGQVSRTVAVALIDNTTFEPTETFLVNLSNATAGATIADGQGIGTVLDNDPAPSTKFYVVNDASQNRTYEYNSSGGAVENYLLNSGNTAPRGAASTAVGDKTWVVDANKKVYVYDTAGALLGSWTAGSLASNATVEGITTNGTDVWIVDARQDRVYRYAGAATRTSGSQTAASSFALNSGNRGPKGITTDGTSLWVVNNNSTDKVFKYTTGGSLLGSWTMTGGGGSPTGITIDPSNASDIWIVDSSTDRVYQYTAAASRTSGSQSASATFNLAGGNTNPQGIADPPAGAVASSVVSAWEEAAAPAAANIGGANLPAFSTIAETSAAPRGAIAQRAASMERRALAARALIERAWIEVDSDDSDDAVLPSWRADARLTEVALDLAFE